jgi:4-hydroxy-tetrahydrodipicolinate reductase
MIFGLGKVGLVAARYLVAKKIPIIGAFDKSQYTGRDLGLVLGGAAIGTIVQDRPDNELVTGAADVALFFTTGSLDDLLGDAKACLEAGINVLTVAEAALFPWTFDPDLSAELDRIAKAGGATLAGTGVTDGIMVHLSAVLAACAPTVTGIRVDCVGDFGRLGPAALGGMPLGLAPGEFEAILQASPLAGAKPPPSIGGQVAEALASLLGLKVRSLEPGLALELARSDIHVESLNRTISAGAIAGLTETISMITDEGVKIDVRLTAKVFEAGDEEFQVCTVDGVVPMTLKVSPLPGVEVTAASAVNRIPDILAALPGFQTIDRLSAPLYRNAKAFGSPG